MPYKGAAPATNDLLAGQVDFTVENVITVAPLVKAGAARALAVTTRERSQILPDVPTLAEQGYPDIDVGAWLGVLVSAKTPPAVVARLERSAERRAGRPGREAAAGAAGRHCSGRHAGRVRRLHSLGKGPLGKDHQGRRHQGGMTAGRAAFRRRPATHKERQWLSTINACGHGRSTTASDRYTARDRMIYALGLGYGGDPLDEAELRYA